MLIEVPDDFVEKMVRDELFRAISDVFDDVIWLHAKINRSDFEDANLADGLRALQGLKEAWKHYTLRGEWHKLDRFKVEV